MLTLMVDKLVERKQRQSGQVPEEEEMSEESFFHMAGIVHEVKHGD